MPATSSSTSADPGRFVRDRCSPKHAVPERAYPERNARCRLCVLFRTALLLLLLATVAPVSAQRSAQVSRVHGNLFCVLQVQDSLPLRTMLESGIPFPLIDSALVWAHPELFQPVRLESPIRFRMASGARYEARYKLPAGLRAGDSRSLCPCYVVDLERRSEKLLYPLQTFTTDSLDAPGMFELDIRRGMLRMLREEELPATDGEWYVYEMTPDRRTGMFCVEATLTLAADTGREERSAMQLVIDLGNANLLALFTFRPQVGDFVVRSGTPRQEAESRSGRRFDVLMPSRVTFMDAFAFEALPVLLLDAPVRLPGDGFLGVRFFERYRTIFDFRHGRLLLAYNQASFY